MKLLCLKYFIGEDACLPEESVNIVIEGDCLSINEDVYSSPAKADGWKKPEKRI